MTTPHAVVVGAGIGGLAAALSLTRAGVRVTVLERGATPPDGGLPIGLCWNAVHALRCLGVADAVLAGASLAYGGEIRDCRDRLIATIRDDMVSPTAPALAAVVPRRSLLSVLSSSLSSSSIRFRVSCIGFTIDDRGATVHVEGSDDVRADVLVGADGLHSRVRGDRGRVRYTGVSAWRGVGRQVAHLLPDRGGIEWWGDGAVVGAHHLADLDVYWYARYRAPAGATSTRPATIAEIGARFGHWPDRFLSMVGATRPDGIVRTDIYDLSLLLRWGTGRVTLLGDAAHAMSPVLGQGGGTALEDAVILGRCVARYGCTADALRRYERARRWRSLAFAETSHLWSHVMHTRQRRAAWMRDRAVGLLLRLPAQRRFARMMTAWECSKDIRPPAIGGHSP